MFHLTHAVEACLNPDANLPMENENKTEPNNIPEPKPESEVITHQDADRHIDFEKLKEQILYFEKLLRE